MNEHTAFLIGCLLTPIIIIFLLRRFKVTGPKVEKDLKKELNETAYKKRKSKIQLIFGSFIVLVFATIYYGYETSRSSQIDSIIYQMENILENSHSNSLEKTARQWKQLQREIDKVYIEGIKPNKKQRRKLKEIENKMVRQLGNSMKNIF